MKQELSVIGIDIAKRVFHLVGMDARGFRQVVDPPPQPMTYYPSP